jgi:hypothetical protein
MQRTAATFADMAKRKARIPDGWLPEKEVTVRTGFSRQTLYNFRYGHEKRNAKTGELYSYDPILKEGSDWKMIHGRVYYSGERALAKIADHTGKSE